MPRLLALLGVLALLVAPLNAGAAQRACTHLDMDPSGQMLSPEAHAAPAVGDMADMQCCDPHGAKRSDACIAACVVMAGVVADLPQPFSLPTPTVTGSRFEIAVDQAARPHPPPGVKRPPRPIA
ncbi:MAG: hypothetical protein EPO51_25025 [Phenylobacterium sp.]|uniref:hypothetical protein n=1 Tax=Phenylobacterium sp. TaxID=1871053 RepID=UPI00120809A3|nr:hypothetical protein [Phenylobacterium sp.]TAJ68798.1 MAG: hypothetical protein EPO51_25025 [Phenylobacterium sp.]